MSTTSDGLQVCGATKKRKMSSDGDFCRSTGSNGSNVIPDHVSNMTNVAPEVGMKLELRDSDYIWSPVSDALCCLTRYEDLDARHDELTVFLRACLFYFIGPSCRSRERQLQW